MSRLIVVARSSTIVDTGPAYYVSTAPNASDNNLGTQTSPFRTIQHAANVATAGYTVHVAPGVYAERIVNSTAGTSSNHIRFISDTKWGAKISPTDAGGTGWWGSLAWNCTGNYVDIIGFEITPGSGGGITGGILIHNCSNSTAQGNKIHNINKHATMVGNGPGGINFEGTNVSAIANYIYDIGDQANTLTHCIYVSSGTANVINNVVGSCTGFGLVTWHDAGTQRWINNTMFSCHEGGISLGDGESSSYVTDSIMANNIAYGNYGRGFREFGQLSGTLWVNNLAYNNTQGNTIALLNGTEVGTVINDPVFVNYLSNGTGDYHIQGSSYARDAGSALYAPTTDFDGTVRPQGSAPDIGAYEFF